MRGYLQWWWHLDEVFVKVNGKLCYLWRAVDHEGEVLGAVATAKRDKAAALKFLKRINHEGWKLVRERYDDGGFSGGSMERPALQKLLEDVKARKIDVVVVYKVDRLTRSLADFEGRPKGPWSVSWREGFLSASGPATRATSSRARQSAKSSRYALRAGR